VTPAAQRVHAVKSMSYSTHAVLAADDLFELQESKAYLFEIASKSMRLHKNILRTAYTMQKFGKMVRGEIKKELVDSGCAREEAKRRVTERLQKLIHTDDSAEANRALADRMAERIDGKKEMTADAAPGSPLRLAPRVFGDAPRQTKIAVNGESKDRVSADHLQAMVSDADDLSLADLFALQQTVIAQAEEWQSLESKLLSAIQLRAMKELEDKDKKAKAAEADKGKRRKSFAD